MTTNELSIIWDHNFHEIPSQALLERFAEYCNMEEDYERRLFWLILKSQGHFFESESERALWIIKRLPERDTGTSEKAA